MPPPASGIDLDRYPLDRLESAVGQQLVAHCQAQLASEGASELPGFLTPAATKTMAMEAAAIADRAHHHRGASTPYLEIPPTDLAENHPRRTTHPFSLGAVAWDDIPESHRLHQLYLSDGLLEFLAATLGKERLYRYADPLGACNVAVMGDQDELEWHFDQADFVVSIALQPPDDGGDFLYAPKIRSEHDEHYEEIASLLAGDESRVKRIPMKPGTLLLFHGRHSIHRVTTVRGGTMRLVALLAYDSKPGVCATPFLQQARYGRVLQPA